MISKEVLRRIVFQQKEQLTRIEDTTPRETLTEILKWIEDKRIIILTGIRRCGKSTILKQIIANTKNYCYVNFEGEGFIDFQAKDFELLNEALIETYGNPKIYFFDEIQNIDKFETFIRRLQDANKKIVITGSNASLLSKELGTRLTGRYKPFEVFPFSFKEFLEFKKIRISEKELYNVHNKVLMIQAFKEYLEVGGFPEYLKNKDPGYIQTIYENILYRDIISRYNIKKQKTIKELANILSANISEKITYNSLKNNLTLSNAITVKEYISYLNNAYIFFELLKFDYSIKKQLNAPRKIYIIDPALKTIGLQISQNKEKILENAIFLHLRRVRKEIYYYSQKGECDFVIRDKLKITEAIQACYELTDKNKKREVDGLMEAMTEFKLSKGTIITLDQEDEIKIEGKTIKIIPAWKWMTNSQ